MNTTEFDVLDSMPGSGKTEYFVKQATSSLQKENPNHILLYVAPTAKLLQEVYTRLQKHNDLNLLKKKVKIAISSEHHTDFNNTLGYLCPTPVAYLDYALGLITKQEAELKDVYGVDVAKPGDIILTTHQSFLLIKENPSKGLTLDTLSNTWVIFDEARRCVTNNFTLTLPSAILAHLSLFSPQKIPLNKNKYKDVNLLKLTKAPSKLELKSALELTSNDRLPDDVIKIVSLVKGSVVSGRASVHILVRSRYDDLIDSASKSKPVSVFTIISPERLFQNYGKVTLTSAFFKDSQMYQFLKKQGASFRFLLDLEKLPPTLRGIKDRDLKLRMLASKNLYYASLLDGTDQLRSSNRYKHKLTTYLLTNSVVVPKSFVSKLDSFKDSRNINRDKLLKECIKCPEKITPNENDIRLLKKYIVPPLWVLMFQAYHILKDWYKSDKFKALTILNSRESVKRWIPGNITFREAIADARANNASQDEDVTKQTNINRKFMPEFWSKFFEHTKGCLTIPRTPSLQGLNEWSNYNHFIHLGALNPDPNLILVFEILLPDYDIDSDHYLDNLVQTLYRTSLRNPESTEKVLMIVPFSRASRELYLKLELKSNSSFQEFKHNIPPLVGWSGEDTETAAKNRALAISKAKLLYTIPEKKELNSILVRLNRISSLSNTTIKQELKRKELEARKKLIMKNASLRKKERQMQEEEDDFESVDLAGYGDY